MITAARAIVEEVLATREGAQDLRVSVDGAPARAISYRALIHDLSPGDEVLVNTTAVDLGLGTGGCHIVIASLSQPDGRVGDGPGHIMKLRYTPHQHAVLSLEEEGSPHRAAIQGFQSLHGFPIILGSLHSHVAPVAIAIKTLLGPTCRIAYIMTDPAALAIGFSRLVSSLRERALLDLTITSGQAFGGDYEAVNPYTAIIAAREAFAADAVIVCQGPGNVGTGTPYGFGGIEQGALINAVGVLGGTPISVLRISFAEARDRHTGISHHSLTSIGRVALSPALVPIPILDSNRMAQVTAQLEHAGIPGRLHSVELVDCAPILSALDEHKDLLRSMGRSYDEDREFFYAGAAAGIVASQRRADLAPSGAQ